MRAHQSPPPLTSSLNVEIYHLVRLISSSPGLNVSLRMSAWLLWTRSLMVHTQTLSKRIGGSNMVSALQKDRNPIILLQYSLGAGDRNGDTTSTFTGTLWTFDCSLQLACVGKREYQSLACVTGCGVQVPGVGVAVIIFNEHLPAIELDGAGSTGTGFTDPGDGGGSRNGSAWKI
ncbi:hypothetical protein BDM02DRAFT_3132216 [Thelephora ganbajun]|uniref:Uncharacterized protein n=1 Tax=Thelephora ganbajun TaxID=370292 RepID=A0ACB6Z3N7_THEGA|nr:hypothetical protein BDM02DRAFT_3132216 [Thelephora ganbajun]